MPNQVFGVSSLELGIQKSGSIFHVLQRSRPTADTRTPCLLLHIQFLPVTCTTRHQLHALTIFIYLIDLINNHIKSKHVSQ